VIELWLRISCGGWPVPGEHVVQFGCRQVSVQLARSRVGVGMQHDKPPARWREPFLLRTAPWITSLRRPHAVVKPGWPTQPRRGWKGSRTTDSWTGRLPNQQEDEDHGEQFGDEPSGHRNPDW